MPRRRLWGHEVEARRCGKEAGAAKSIEAAALPAKGARALFKRRDRYCQPRSGSAAGAIGKVKGPAIAQCLGDVMPRHCRRAFEIGQGARHTQHAVIAARR